MYAIIDKNEIINLCFEEKEGLRMKKFLIVIIVIIILGIIVTVQNCTNPTTTYYYDENGNGREDFGEGVWYEDKDGVHFFD